MERIWRAPKKVDSTEEWLYAALAELPDFYPKRMFGGVGLFSEGMMFGVLFGGRLYFKTDEATRRDYLAQGMKPFRPNPRVTLHRYYEVPAEVMAEETELMRWARRALLSVTPSPGA